MNKFRPVVFILFLLFPVWLHAQQLAEHNLYHYNLALINPAAAAYMPCKQFIVTDRHQWIGIEGAPSVQSFSAQLPRLVHKYRKYGLGLNLVHDANGAIQNFGGELQYAYHLTLRTLTPQYLSFGLAGKFGQYSFDESDFNRYLYDPLITYGRQVEWYYNFSAGIFLYSEKYYTGIGMYNLFPRNTYLYNDYGNESFFTTFIAGYYFQPRGSDNKLSPSVYFARGNSFYQFDVNGKIYFTNGFWSGLCFRKYIGDFYNSGQNALVFLGYQFSKWDITYTYDIGLNKLQRYHTGSHQISLTYTLCRDKYDCKAY